MTATGLQDSFTSHYTCKVGNYKFTTTISCYRRLVSDKTVCHRWSPRLNDDIYDGDNSSDHCTYTSIKTTRPQPGSAVTLTEDWSQARLMNAYENHNSSDHCTCPSSKTKSPQPGSAVREGWSQPRLVTATKTQ